jgi:hypothetical protein
MKIKFIAATILIFCILFINCHAQTKANFQSVGGDFGRAWLKDFLAENPDRQPKAQNSTTLWNWGGAPKGMMVQNGSLVADPYYFWKSLNYTSGWMGQVYIDPITGYPIYAYIDPFTGYPDYFYMDPKTGKPVYVNGAAAALVPGYDNDAPYHWPYAGMPTSSNYPWLGDPAGLPLYGSAGDYGGLGMA